MCVIIHSVIQFKSSTHSDSRFLRSSNIGQMRTQSIGISSSDSRSRLAFDPLEIEKRVPTRLLRRGLVLYAAESLKIPMVQIHEA